MKNARHLRVFAATMIAAWFLVSCGGGGGGGDGSGGATGGGNNFGNGPVCPTTWAPPTGPLVTLGGIAQYERIGQKSNGGLDYANITTQPVKGATVELIYQCQTIATTQTSASGQYNFVGVPGGNVVSVRVKAELKQTSGAATWDVTVRDNTAGDALYAMQSVDFNAGTGTVQNLTAASGWDGASYSQIRAAGPFAILDTIYSSQQKIVSAQPTIAFPLLQVFWSVKNNLNDGLISDGDIGTSFFTATGSGSAITSRSIYILGQANQDTDEYDNSVIAHEWGHYYQNAFSRDDSMGGNHGGADDRLDRRIAFSEGWGNALSGIVLSKSTYSDSKGANQASGFVLSLNSGHASSATNPKGWFRESSIQYILWDLNRQVGFTEIHRAMSGSAFKNGSPLTDIHAFSAAYRTAVGSTSTLTIALNTLLTSESINSTSNAYGSNETNNGGSTTTLPYYRDLNANGTAAVAGQTICTTSLFSGAERNKLGYFAYARVLIAAAGSKTITVTSSTLNSDVDFQLYKNGQRIFVADVAANQSETKPQNLAAGEHILVIYDFNKVANTCYTVSIS